MRILRSCYACMLVMLLLPISLAYAYSISDLERTTVGQPDSLGYAYWAYGANGDYLDLGSFGFTNLTSWSYEIWLWPNEPYPGYIARAFSARETGVENSRFRIYRYSAYYGFLAKFNDASRFLRYTYENPPVNTPRQYVLRYNGSRCHLFLNGSSLYSASFPNKNMTIDEAYLFCEIVGSSCFNGTIDEFRFWNRSITNQEITDNYNNYEGVATPNTTGLILWYDFNEGSGSTVYDKAGVNNATIHGNGEFIEGHNPTYSDTLTINNLPENFNITLEDSDGVELDNAQANSSNIALLTLDALHRENLEGTFYIYDDNGSFLFSKWLPDIYGGDIYRVNAEGYGVAIGIIGFTFGLVALVVAMTIKSKK